MSSNWVEDIRYMQSVYGVHTVVDDMDKDKLHKYLEFRTNFLQEELDELKQAMGDQDQVEILDALLDIVVVTIGAMHSMGADAEGGWKEVMKTNFAKVDKETGKVRKREDGKVLKPVGWTPPNLSPFTSKDIK